MLLIQQQVSLAICGGIAGHEPGALCEVEGWYHA